MTRRQTWGCWISILCIVAAATAYSPELAAQTPKRDEAGAEALFDAGVKLLKAGQYSEACAKLEESQRLDAALGTLLYLSDCYEKSGRTASAWASFRAAASTAQLRGETSRQVTAAGRADALEPILSRLSVVVPATSDISGIVVRRDGVELSRASWGTAMPVDPGVHVISASAPGRKSWTKSVRVAADKLLTETAVPVLETVTDAGDKTPPGTAPSSSAADATKGDGQRLAGYIVGGTGVAGIVVGTVFGLLAKSKDSESQSYCYGSNPMKCNATGLQLNHDAKNAATVSTAGFIAGGAAIVIGAIVLLAAPSRLPESKSPANLRLVADANANGASLTLSGAW